MAKPPLWTVSLLVVGGVLLGLVLGEVVRWSAPHERAAEWAAAQERVASLERQLERLRASSASRPASTQPRRLVGRGSEEGDARSPGAAAAPVVGEVRSPAEAGDGGSAGRATDGTLALTDVAVLEVIRRLGAENARQSSAELVGPAFAARFAPVSQEQVVRADELESDAPLEDGTVVVLDEGVYDFSAFSNAHRGAFPADLTFRGLGRDRTLLVLHEVSATGEMRNLAFEDLTLHTRGHYLADVRGDEPISLRFDRARVIGFDGGDGGAVLLAARHGAILARDTEFEAGFGSAPGTGSFFHVRGPFLVRFERCTVRGHFKSLYERSDKAAYAYDRCRFEQMHPDRRRDLETPDANVQFMDCAIDYAAPPGAGVEPRAISELNAAWR